jgi:winged helix DNA-binding protein
VSDDERRARLAVRQALAPAHRVASPEAVTRAMTVLHSTEPATVHLSCWARTDSVTAADVDRALHTDRTVVKQLAMRRTLFAVPRDLLPAMWPSASARVAGSERARMTKDVIAAGLPADWLDQARTAILAAVAGVPDGLSGLEIRRAVPMIAVSMGGAWSASRVITYLGATADLARGVNAARWFT